MHHVHNCNANCALDTWPQLPQIPPRPTGQRSNVAMYVISGASGNTGKIAATKLLAAGKKVRALVRDPAKAKDLAAAGAEVVAVDLSDSAGLSRALEGATGFYLLSPPDMGAKDFVTDRTKLLGEVATVVKTAKVPHVVLLSSIG